MPGFEIFGEEEKRQVQDVLETGVLFRYGFDKARNGHWKALSFEKELAKRIGVAHAHLCSTGTAALSTALAACGVGAGDEVIVTPFTFIATVESILMAGAIPVFAEIDDSLCLDPSSIEPKLTKKTKAVIPVHMCGAMAKIDTIAALCKKHRLILIEDACQALGATFNNKPIGSFGNAACFSFDAVKTVTCGEGGGIVTDDEKIYTNAFRFADHGHDHIGNDRGLENHPILGLNFRICELNAAVGLAQIAKLDSMIEIQRKTKKILSETLLSCHGVTLQNIPDPAGDSATHISFILSDEDKARYTSKMLAQDGVDGCFYWFDNNWHYIRQWNHLRSLSSTAKLPVSLAGYNDFSFIKTPVSDSIISRTISMQIKLSWSDEDIKERCRCINKILK